MYFSITVSKLLVYQVDAKKQGILLLPLTVHSLFLSPAIFSRLCDFRPTFELPWIWCLRFPPLVKHKYITQEKYPSNTSFAQNEVKVEKMIELVSLEHLHSGKLLETRSFRMWLQNLIQPVGGYRPQAEATMERSKTRATSPPPEAQQMWSL